MYVLIKLWQCGDNVTCFSRVTIWSNQSINQSNFYSANMPVEARLSGATAKSVFNSKIEATDWECCGHCTSTFVKLSTPQNRSARRLSIACMFFWSKGFMHVRRTVGFWYWQCIKINWKWRQFSFSASFGATSKQELLTLNRTCYTLLVEIV